MPKGADYEDGNLLENYKKIKEGFSFDYEEKINEFIAAEVTEEDSNYNVYMNIRNYFSHKTIYKISTYNNNEQRIIVEGLLTDDEKKLVKELIDVSKFNIVKFTNRLDELIKNSDPKIYIYVSDKNLKFNDLHKNYLIKTTVEKLNSISDAYVLIEEVGGDDKNMYSYGIFKINSEKRIQELYYITSVEHESVTKLNNVSEKYFWVKRNFSEDNLQSDDSSFPVTEEQLKLWTSYCILTSEIYKKYSNILPTGLF